MYNLFMALNIKTILPLDHPHPSSSIEEHEDDRVISLATGSDDLDSKKNEREDRPKDHNIVLAKAQMKINIISS